MDYQRLEWPFPWRGLYTERHAKDIPPDALSSCVNMYYQNPYTLRARGGIDYQYAGSGSDDAKVLYYWDHDAKLYHADDNAHLYKNGVAVSGPTLNVVAMCSFGTGATPILIVAESGGVLYTYNGTTYAALTGTGVVKGTKLMVRGGRLFTLGSPTYPSRIAWSSGGDYTTWTGAFGEGGYLDVAPSADGDALDWVDFQGTLYVFKEHGIYKIAGDEPSSFSVMKVAEADGVIAGTVRDCGKGVLYATGHGVFPLGLPFEAESLDLTKNVETLLQAFLSSNQAAYSPELGGYVVVNGTTTAYVSNIGNRPDAWTTFALPISASAVYEGNGLWFGDTAGKIYKYLHTATTDDTTGSGTTAISTSLKTGHWNISDALIRKEIGAYEGHFNARRNATATVDLYEDGSGTTSHTGVYTAALRQLGKCKLDCETIALQVAYTAPTGPPAFGGLALHIVRKDAIK